MAAGLLGGHRHAASGQAHRRASGSELADECSSAADRAAAGRDLIALQDAREYLPPAPRTRARRSRSGSEDSAELDGPCRFGAQSRFFGRLDRVGVVALAQHDQPRLGAAQLAPGSAGGPGRGGARSRVRGVEAWIEGRQVGPAIPARDRVGCPVADIGRVAPAIEVDGVAAGARDVHILMTLPPPSATSMRPPAEPTKTAGCARRRRGRRGPRRRASRRGWRSFSWPGCLLEVVECLPHGAPLPRLPARPRSRHPGRPSGLSHTPPRCDLRARAHWTRAVCTARSHTARARASDTSAVALARRAPRRRA